MDDNNNRSLSTRSSNGGGKPTTMSGRFEVIADNGLLGIISQNSRREVRGDYLDTYRKFESIFRKDDINNPPTYFSS